MGIVVDIQAGEGGDDSKLFVEDLLTVYLKYAERNSLKTELISKQYGKVSIKILGEQAASLFENEPGKHVVQRVPPTETKGRWQTSVVTVAILPIQSDQKYVLKENEIETTTQRGHGSGGQHQNTTDSAVRMIHIPTGTTVFINGRDQHQNKKEARKILEARVAEIKKNELHNVISSNKQKQVDGGGRGNKVRTYNFIKHRVVDHRLETKTTQIDKIMRGQLELLWTKNS